MAGSELGAKTPVQTGLGCGGLDRRCCLIVQGEAAGVWRGGCDTWIDSFSQPLLLLYRDGYLKRLPGTKSNSAMWICHSG